MAFSLDSNILCPVSDFFVPGVWQTVAKRDPTLSDAPTYNDFVFFVAFLAAVDECTNTGPIYTVDALECPGGGLPSFDWQMEFEWNPNVVQDLIAASTSNQPWNWPTFGLSGDDRKFFDIPGTYVMALEQLQDYSANGGFFSVRGANNTGGFKIGLAFGYPEVRS